MLRTTIFWATLACAALGQQNHAARDLGGHVLEAPDSLSVVHGSARLIDGDPDGPPFESARGLEAPLRVALAFRDGHPVLVERVRLLYGGVDPDSRPTRVVVRGSPFGPGLAVLQLGSLAPGPSRAELVFPEPLPLRYLLLELSSAGQSVGLGEIEVLGRAAPEGLETPAEVAVERAVDIPVENTELERGLWAALEDGEALDPLDVALIASGVRSPTELRRYRQRCQELSDEVGKAHKLASLQPAERGAVLLQWLHQERFAHYDADASDVRAALDGESFQCVTASVVFEHLARQAGLELRNLETGDHVLCQVRLGDRWADVETTLAQGFDPDPDKIQRLREQRGFAGRIQRRRPLPAYGLAAAIYHNRAYDALRERDFRAAIEAAVKSLRLDPDSEVTLTVLLATFNDWAGQLASQGSFPEALTVIRRARRIAGLDLALLCQELGVYGMWMARLLRDESYAEALAMLDAALEGPEEQLMGLRPVLEHFRGEAQAQSAWNTFHSSAGRAWREALGQLQGGSPAEKETRRRIFASWAEAPRADEPALAAREHRARVFVRYRELLAVHPEDPQLRTLVEERIDRWAAEELEGSDILASRMHLGRLRTALVLYDDGLEALGSSALLSARRDALIRRIQREMALSPGEAIWASVELLRETDQPTGWLNAAQLSLLIGWAQGDWERSRPLLQPALLDTDGDGQLSAEELLGEGLPAAKLDGDHNGRVSSVEIRAWLQHAGRTSAERFELALGHYPDDRELQLQRRAFVLEYGGSLRDLGFALAAAQLFDAAAAGDAQPELLLTSRDHELGQWVRTALAAADHETAAARLAQAQEAFPQAAVLVELASELYLAWAEAELRAGRGFAALGLLNQGLQLVPGHAGLRSRRLGLYYQLAEAAGKEDPQLAAHIYGLAADAEPDESSFAYNQAVYWSRWAEQPWRDGTLGQSVERYAELLEQHPENTALREAGARFFDLAAREPIASEAWEAALAIYERGLELLPENPVLLRNQAYCLERQRE